MTEDERREVNRAWHEKRRARGVCGTCETPVTTINKRTGWPYWNCADCRARIGDWRRRRRMRAAEVAS